MGRTFVSAAEGNTEDFAGGNAPATQVRATGTKARILLSAGF